MLYLTFPVGMVQRKPLAVKNGPSQSVNSSLSPVASSALIMKSRDSFAICQR
jgi:hypothetical protein